MNRARALSAMVMAISIGSGGCDGVSNTLNGTSSQTKTGGAGGRAQGGAGGQSIARSGQGGEGGSSAQTGAGGQAGSGASYGGAGGPTGSDGLPCEIQTIVTKYCTSCHGSTPVGGASRSLVTYSDLTAADVLSSNVTEAQASLQRMQNKVAPMPPSPMVGPSAAEIATFQAWIVDGYPKGACGVSGAGGSSSVSNSGGASGQAGSGGARATGGAGGSSTSPSPTGLPCDVQAVFVDRCGSCHGSSLSGGAPRSLVTYANLVLADPANPSLTEAQVSLQRAQNTVAPMPPAPAAPLTSSEIAIIQSWISSGYPKGTCGQSTGGSSGNGSGGSTGTGGQGGSSGAGGSSSGRDAGSTANGLPCEIQTVVATYCDSCHGSPTAAGAPRSLVTYANLTMADPANPSLTEAQVSLQRMQSTVAPMPPAPAAAVPATAITAFQNWINSGYPTGSCSTGGTGGAGAGGASGSGGNGAGGSSGGADAGTAGGSLPCDVQTLLVNRCDSCHGTSPAGGAPRPLVTYANLTMADPANPALTEAQASLARMQSTTSPMPPSPAAAATSAEIATLQNWINAGYPSGSCGGDAGAPPPPDPLNAAPTCTSKVTWTRGNSGSSLMNPGQACIACHSAGGEGPRYVIAGTLYPTGHEPNNCDGTNGTTGARIVVTGSNGSTITLTPNAAGNFYSSTTLPGPYQAKVVDSTGKERVMVSTASSGDCNSCHTQSGANGAPGRITLP